MAVAFWKRSPKAWAVISPLVALAALSFGGVMMACSSDDATSPADTPASADASVDVATPVADAGADVGPVTLGPADPTCDPGEPTSCCFGKKKYNGRPGADTSCGPDGNEYCCAYDSIPGGMFNRSNDPAFPATLPGFKLGRYLVTTARFKVWMDEGGGLQSKAPAAGAGAVPGLEAQTGWKTEWNANLAKTVEDLALSVYKDPGSDGWGCTLDFYPQRPNYPMTCVNWYQMQAFCAWDGGYAITEAMWEYATRGGSEQRPYAWGNDAPTSQDTSVYCLEGGGMWNVDLWCNNPTNPVPQNVGFSRNGKGKFGTYDLMGNALNITVDDRGANFSSSAPMGDYPMPCTNNCVSRRDGETRANTRGIAFLYPNSLQPAAYTNMIAKRSVTMRKDFNGANFSFRCAYPDAWPATQPQF